MAVVSSSEISMNLYQITRRHIPEHSTPILHNHRIRIQYMPVLFMDHGGTGTAQSV
jgi:hypothetical protein